MSSESDPAQPSLITQRIARAINAGELERFDELYARVAPALYAWAQLRVLKELRKHIDAEDVVQEVWIRALEIFDRFDPDKQSFRPWLFSVAKLVLLEASRRVRRRRTEVAGHRAITGALFELNNVPDSVTGISTRMARDDSIKRFVEHVRQSDPLDHQVLVHFGLEGLSGEVAAQRIGISREAAFKRWQRLRKRLQEQGIGDELLVD
ncbi:MAG: RNA polymerase sigma-70 factor (ECF subfamily) [Planctomycetota bacterium]|jgi:RNA polymerase sigma-70 factor (ECF subfamily)